MFDLQEANPRNGSEERSSFPGKDLGTRLRAGINFTAEEKFKKRGWGEPHLLGRKLNLIPGISLQRFLEEALINILKTRQDLVKGNVVFAS